MFTLSEMGNPQPSSIYHLNSCIQFCIPELSMGIIYKLTSPDGKCYVGQTTYSFNVRMSGHKSASSDLEKTDGCRYLNNAIRHHGWNNFSKEILTECENDELDFYEAYFIEEYNSLAPHGYNLTKGGNTNKVYSEETKEKLRQTALKRDSAAYRKNERTKGYPKYLGIFQGYPRITKHPSCSSKPFNDKSKSFDENLRDALEFLDKLNKGEVKVEIPKPDKPKGLQNTKGGYRVRRINKHGIPITKLFTDQNVPLETRRKQAEEYLAELIRNDN